MNTNEQEFKKLFHGSYKKLYTVSFGIMKNHEAAEDVLQDSYIKAWNRFDDFDPSKNFTNWMTTIVRNTAIDLIRNHKRSAHTVSLDSSHMSQNKAVVWDIEDRTQDIVSKYEKKELCVQIREAIEQLPEELKRIMGLLTDDVNPQSYKEAADILHEPVASVRAKAHRARIMIQNHISGVNVSKKTNNL